MMRRYGIAAAVAICISIWCGSAYIAKINGIQGLSRAHFSFLQCILPLTGMLFGMIGSCGLFFGIAALRLVGLMSWTYYGLPTVCASLCWATAYRMIRIGIPLLCMLLFICHPIGYYAAPYALYWLIPILCSFARKENRFLTALSSTFVAHAVGSVLHLYIINPMTSAAWLELIPIVAIERLVLSLGMYVTYGVITLLLHFAYAALQNNFRQRPAVE